MELPAAYKHRSMEGLKTKAGPALRTFGPTLDVLAPTDILELLHSTTKVNFFPPINSRKFKTAGPIFHRQKQKMAALAGGG